MEAGVDALDASLGGIGGCPFAPNATGNIPTEDLVFMLERMGVDTGLDLARLAAVVPWIEAKLGKRVPGLLSKAGLFPAARRLISGSPTIRKGSVEDVGDGVEGKAGEATDHRAVDADVLQVRAEQQLETARRLRRVPSFDRAAHERQRSRR